MVRTRLLHRATRIAAVLGVLQVMGICGSTAQPRDYPLRPVRVIVPTPPGGPVDIIARITADYLDRVVGSYFVVDNMAGAGNTIGSKVAADATPDGYTLLYSAASGLIVAPLLHPDAGYDPLSSYDPIALVGASSNILVVNPAVPANSVAELVAYAKANPGKLNFSSGGIGVLPHLIGEMFKARADIDIVHVPYKGGGPSINDLLGGHVQMTFEGTSVLLPLIQAGKLRALAVTTPQRIPQLPEVPTMVESGFPNFVSESWTGLLAPARTPSPIIEKLNAAINEGLQTPELIAALSRISYQPLGGTPRDFTATIKSELAKWSPIVKSLGLDKP